jgi:CheY-like chemotaxis protein
MIDNQPRHSRKILVVDDNPVILKALFSFLAPKGYEVIIALDGLEVVDCVRRQKPDLILLDIFFPPKAEGGLIWDGFLVLDWLRKPGNGPGIPVFIISGAEPEKYKDRCLAAGARGYFQKPIPLTELLATIQSTFGSSPPKENTDTSGLAADIS